MDRNTILSPEKCDLRRLPLGTLEAFVLSQVDGHSTLEEIALITGLELAVAIELASRLVQLGAVRAPRNERASARSSRAPARGKTRAPPPIERTEKRSLRPPRHDPRVEPSTMPPRRRSSTPRAHAVRATKRPSAIAIHASATARKSSAPERPPTRKSLRAPTMSGARQATEPCELDEATQALIAQFEARLGTDDHYAFLGIDRGAEKKAVKHAYFALASKYHPDRFFKKKLGHLRPSLERVFQRMTEAHDVLTDAARREAYDRTLPPPTLRSSKAPPRSARPSKAPASRSSKAPPGISTRPSKAPPSTSIRPSKAPPATLRSSKAPPPVPRISKAPPSARPSKLPPPTTRSAPPKSVPSRRPPATNAIVPPPVKPAISIAAKLLSGSMRRAPPTSLQRIEVQRRVDVFVRAGDEALKANDVIGAANNYRLALQNTDDPALRAKLEMVDEMAKMRRFELCLPRARTAEREQRWADAAAEYLKAHEARPSADTAERAAHALRMSTGDLARATALAEYAVSKAPHNSGYRITLGEVCLAARQLDRAAAEAERAISIAPTDPRARELAAAVRKSRR